MQRAKVNIKSHKQQAIFHMCAISITRGFLQTERTTVANLYWEAFSGKLGRVMAPPPKALAFFTSALNPAFALSARNNAGDLMGLAGFKTTSGALIEGGLKEMAAVYGWPGALWRGTALSLLERDTVTDTLLMDGLFVAPHARGMGAGTALIAAIKQQAIHQGLSNVRLDVIDSNPRARALYERQGFVATGTDHLGPLRHIFGFNSATKMVCDVTT
ncbi:GNAT family N-acetyltransferase [Shimia sp.]|uniref:GNAT family N-acetyltransferase n=1 Tax=Shimia sp. TaxID=1954381 RepID=UPI003299305B